MRDSRRKYLLPLKVGVPYKMVNGQRRVFDCIEDIAFNGYDLTTGQHNTNGFDLDITEFYMEDGIWESYSRDNILVTTRVGVNNDTEYSLQGISLSPMYKRLPYYMLTEDGYEYSMVDDTAREMDIIGYVRPITSEEAQNYVWFQQKVGREEYELIHDKFPIAWNTGAHISTVEPELVAYFPTQKHWDSKVPQKIKAGRYLKKYFPDMSDDEVREKANLLTGNKRTLKVLTHWYAMFKAYRTLDVNGIVSSCMTKDCWRPVHPLMVYHESDVVLAVMYEGDAPKARALINKNTKEYNIIYGQWERMLPMLAAAGYTHGCLDGAKINKLQRYPHGVDWDDLRESIEPIRTTDNERLLMPYIDGHRDHSRGCNNATSVNVHSDYVEIQKDGDFTANDYENACLGEKEEETEWCELCEENFPYGDGYYLEHEGTTCCNYCYNNNTTQVVTHVSATRGNSWDRITEYYARDNCIWLEEMDTWYMNSSVLEQAGYVWSDYHDEYRYKDDCVCTEDGDWIDKDEEGIVFEFDEAQGEYVLIPKDTKTLDIVDHTLALAA